MHFHAHLIYSILYLSIIIILLKHSHTSLLTIYTIHPSLLLHYLNSCIKLQPFYILHFLSYNHDLPSSLISLYGFLVFIFYPIHHSNHLLIALFSLLNQVAIFEYSQNRIVFNQNDFSILFLHALSKFLIFILLSRIPIPTLLDLSYSLSPSYPHLFIKIPIPSINLRVLLQMLSRVHRPMKHSQFLKLHPHSNFEMLILF